MSEHTDEYDHYHMECEITNLEDKIDDKVRDAVRELSFTVTVD
jgi:hypothetical protein